MAGSYLGRLSKQTCKLIPPADEGVVPWADIAGHGEMLPPMCLGVPGLEGTAP
jgi:hypothetical protein